MRDILNTKEVYSLDSGTYYFDIEKSPTRVWSYKKYDTNVFEEEEDWHIQSVAWKKAGEKTVHCVMLPDFKLYKTEPHNDYELVKYIYDNIFKKATILVGHNINKFDVRMCKHRFMIHGFAPLGKLRTRDTLTMARKFGFFYNSLDNTCRELGLPGKLEEGAGSLWKRCYNGDMKAWKLMAKYNKNDVYINELLDRRLLIWEDTTPALHSHKDKCPMCRGTNFKRNGMKYGRGWEQQRYACLTCGFANIYSDKFKV